MAAGSEAALKTYAPSLSRSAGQRGFRTAHGADMIFITLAAAFSRCCALASVRVLELGSYHPMACVASGAGIAIVPRSVIATVQCSLVPVHLLPKVLSDGVDATRLALR